jgi:programmed cell death protein 5
MADDDANSVYERKLEELQKQRQQELLLRQVLKQILDASAYDRLSNVRVSNPELYAKAAQLLLQLYQSGKIRSRISEGELKTLLARLSPRKETTIKRI